MPTARVSLALLAATAVALSFASMGLAQTSGSLAPRDFKPSRIAVVNIADIFENYEKKKDKEKKLLEEAKVEEKKFQDDKSALDKLQEELKNMEVGTPAHKKQTLLIQEKSYELKSRQQELLKAFQEKQMEALKEIRKEITDDIEKYATGLELDLVLEKQVTAESKESAIHWPIVHYAKPELDITQDIVKRLNTQYGKSPSPSTPNTKSSAPGTAPAPAVAPAGKSASGKVAGKS